MYRFDRHYLYENKFLPCEGLLQGDEIIDCVTSGIRDIGLEYIEYERRNQSVCFFDDYNLSLCQSNTSISQCTTDRYKHFKFKRCLGQYSTINVSLQTNIINASSINLLSEQSFWMYPIAYEFQECVLRKVQTFNYSELSSSRYVEVSAVRRYFRIKSQNRDVCDPSEHITCVFDDVNWNNGSDELNFFNVELELFGFSNGTINLFGMVSKMLRDSKFEVTPLSKYSLGLSLLDKTLFK